MNAPLHKLDAPMELKAIYRDAKAIIAIAEKRGLVHFNRNHQPTALPDKHVVSDSKRAAMMFKRKILLGKP
jgi:hypothetical protein